jgi:hypothetical protein
MCCDNAADRLVVIHLYFPPRLQCVGIGCSLQLAEGGQAAGYSSSRLTQSGWPAFTNQRLCMVVRRWESSHSSFGTDLKGNGGLKAPWRRVLNKSSGDPSYTGTPADFGAQCDIGQPIVTYPDSAIDDDVVLGDEVDDHLLERSRRSLCRPDSGARIGWIVAKNSTSRPTVVAASASEAPPPFTMFRQPQSEATAIHIEEMTMDGQALETLAIAKRPRAFHLAHDECRTLDSCSWHWHGR